jgi:hypothetical protein
MKRRWFLVGMPFVGAAPIAGGLRALGWPAVVAAVVAFGLCFALVLYLAARLRSTTAAGES